MAISTAPSAVGTAFLILPLPVSVDGVRVNAPFADGYDLRMSHLMNELSADTCGLKAHFREASCQCGLAHVAAEYTDFYSFNHAKHQPPR